MEKRKIRVSVICTAYNHEKYIAKALDGFVNQKTDFRYEVIVHDDASTDGTVAIIREYEKRYPDIIRVIYQTENQYSKGIRIMDDIIYPEITGEYVALCEADDYWINDNKLQMQVDFLDRNPSYSAVTHNSIFKDEKNSNEWVQYQQDNDEKLNIGWDAFDSTSYEYVLLSGDINVEAYAFFGNKLKSAFVDEKVKINKYS